MTSDLDSIFEDLPDDHRSGVVAVVGRPNVGKSTLINAILGQKIAIVTPKPQTTRKQQLGIFTTNAGQILFVDTPGLHRPQHKLGEYMVGVAEAALKDADVILWVLDVSEPPETSDVYIAQTLTNRGGDTPIVLALNKSDILNEKSRMDFIAAHTSLIDHLDSKLVSALEGEGVAELSTYLMEQMPQGPRYYPADQLSEVNMRFIAAEVIREKAVLNTEQEVPHAIAVEVDQFKEPTEEDNKTFISATLYVERDSQKGIIIGKGGSMIKQIGSEARADLERTLGSQVFLDLQVKVLKNWRSNDRFMKRLGYRVQKD